MTPSLGRRSAGLSRGFRASVVAALGCTLGIVPRMAAAILGLAALLHASALAFQTLEYQVIARPRLLARMRWVFAGAFGALGARLAPSDR